ncbi:3-oxoacyl-[acyl-carrier-protein] synthase III C-terminal domain-containing protein [Tropicibacter oceani]|uniref:3-oxoacyl-[acyl-carrier-protein] synthase III C-terminal domain-containing protein n=1 Tax=Tropicibacter oceani TaxID=3058420 RepID=A0ABY8QKG2_9RHOB|nr:3-oxoacyl-[acyl-carrier-protein] synthase III C-terminal domain-containing protein [Tropicibacter oceani]WGW04516.1 3-oxoacyl-[acyl-carrier-protein] synthase III C-terminal domain-containing protein [Tropicibacter oceani]
MELVRIAHTMDCASFPDLATLGEAYGWSQRTHRIFDRMFGLQSTALHPKMSLAEGLRLSAQRLADQSTELRGTVDYLVYCHALNTALPLEQETLSQIAAQVFDSTPEVLSVTHGSCASAIMAMQMLRTLPGDRPANIVLLTGEKCFFELLNYADNNGLFGELASAVYLRAGAGQGGTRVAATTAGVFEGVCQPLAKADRDLAASYDQAFIPTMTRAVQTVLDEAGLTADDIDVILPTHLSPFTFNRVAAQLGIPGERVIKQNLSRIGHCFCGDLFINYDTWLQAVPANDRPLNVLSFAAGMTGSYAAIILTKDQCA